MSLQKKVNSNWALGVEGDFASANPRQSALGGAYDFRAGKDGIMAGRFAWVDSDNVTVTQAQPLNAKKPNGFVHRDMNAMMIGYMDEATMQYASGLPIDLFTQGDFYARSSNGGKRGQKVYASTKDGTILCDATGVAHDGFIETDWYCALTANAGELVIISSYPV